MKLNEFLDNLSEVVNKKDLNSAAEDVVDSLEISLKRGISMLAAAKIIIANLEEPDPKPYMVNGDVTDEMVIKFAKDHSDDFFDENNFNDSYWDMIYELTGREQEDYDED